VSTDYDQLAALCDRVVVFGRGHLRRELTGDQVTKEQIAEQCYRVAENHSGSHLDAGGDA
jgi:ribose transport system ATP-binding protein